jgi:D-beta-D-heptose 7-phosphate kinase/D-beta-D-heptose 1-phosphate adenosyltransferase
MGEVVSETLLRDRVAATRARGGRVVFTNGCFDLLHRGHQVYLEEARRLGDLLVVGLNDDASVRRLKGPGRPLRTAEMRAEALCALPSVDLICLFGEDTPERLIAAVRPDVLAKGGDYRPDQVVGAEIVRSYGGRVVTLTFVEGVSTTRILNGRGEGDGGRIPS